MNSKKVWLLTCLVAFFFSINTLQAQKIRNVRFEKPSLTSAEKRVSSAIRQVVAKMQEQKIMLKSAATSFSILATASVPGYFPTFLKDVE